MAFLSSCPKCQRQVLVPEGVCPDAVVQCPLCAGEYSLAEIFASAPPALIVVHPGNSGATAPAAAAAASTAGVIFSAHRVEPALHDAEPLLFENDEVQLVDTGLRHGLFEPCRAPCRRSGRTGGRGRRVCTQHGGSSRKRITPSRCWPSLSASQRANRRAAVRGSSRTVGRAGRRRCALGWRLG